LFRVLPRSGIRIFSSRDALGGLEADEIGRAFLVPTATLAKRLVRAKRKIRDAGILYTAPGTNDMPERLNAVLTVIYLVQRRLCGRAEISSGEPISAPRPFVLDAS